MPQPSSSAGGSLKKENLLVLCIDRDDDLGRKTSFDGPLVGHEDCLKGAIALATADPADTDSNTMFEAIKSAREIGCEVAVVTGSLKVGAASDRIVSSQIDKILSGKGKFDGVILVTDGADDEQLIPIVQSRIKISGIKRVIVKQAERLENTYYTAMDWLKKIVKDKEMARLMLGVPGFVALAQAFASAAAPAHDRARQRGRP